jgi:hypothetical protein
MRDDNVEKPRAILDVLWGIDGSEDAAGNFASPDAKV